MKSTLLYTSCEHCTARVHSIFKGFKNEELAMLNDGKTCTYYKKGQYVFTENGFPLGIFCMYDGKVKLTTSGLDGKEQILRLCKGGDVLGYRALMSNDRYQCSAVALEDCFICFISKDTFFSLVNHHQSLGFEIIKLLSHDLKQAQQHIVTLSQKNVRERMAEALLFIKATYGLQEDGQTINVVLSREEIADFVGTSTESAIRLLSEFNQDKIIQLEGKKIKLLDVDRLTQTANLQD